MEINIDGYSINYKISGEGAAYAIVLQGWGTELSIYDSVAAALSDRYRVLQFDLPGFGRSDEPREAWDVDGYADFFCKFLEALQIKKAALIGHSYGGRVIIKLAARDGLPFTIEKIVLMDSAGLVPKKNLKQRFKIRKYKLLKKLFGNKLVLALFPEVAEDWRSRQGSADYRNATPMMRQCLVKAVNEDLRELLPKVKEEVLLIWGSDDKDTPLSDGKLMEELIPDAALTVLDGCGHYAFLEKPKEFKEILRAFL